jgi:hypothetical protein
VTKQENIEKTGHIPADMVLENQMQADSVHAGSYDEVRYCSVCQAELSRTQIVVAATGQNETTIEALTIPVVPETSSDTGNDNDSQQKAEDSTQTDMVEIAADAKAEPSKVTVASTGKVLKDTKKNSRYLVTSKKNKTVQYFGSIKKKKSTVFIPDTVKIGGVTYKVTSISADAFYGCKKLKSITIQSTKLTEIGENAFESVSGKVTVKVPAAKWKAYKKLLKSCGYKGKVQKVR